MKRDIPIPIVENVWLAVIPADHGSWSVYLINRSKDCLHTVLITSSGHGDIAGQSRKTSILRHMIPHVEPGEYAMIEPMDPSVLSLNNEYLISYFIDKQMYDKKYIFLPDSIKEENMVYIKELDQMGVLHR